MAKIIGIDLGTTRAIVAVMKRDGPMVIPTAEGDEDCPAVVAFDGNGREFVGQAAKRQAAGNPENTIASVKRLLGRSIDDPQTRQLGATAPFQIVSGSPRAAQIHIPVLKRSYTPPAIAAKIVQKLQRDAEAYFGEAVSQAVMTTPACFDDCQRQAILEAGQLAGLEVLRLIDDPIATAFTYSLASQQDQTILIFDLGGGKSEASILELSHGLIQVKASNGDACLGGADWDQRLVRWAVGEFKQETGLDLGRDGRALQRLRQATEQSKIELSESTEVELSLPFVTADVSGPKHLLLKLTRSKFEQLTIDLVGRCHRLLEQTLSQAKLAADDLDQVILAGGAARMPMIQKLVQSLTGKASEEQLNLSQAMALGAAIQGGFYEADSAHNFAEYLDTLFGHPQRDKRRGFYAPPPQRGRDCERTVQISLAEAFDGITRTLERGDRREIEAIIPPGVHSGLRIRLSGQGEPGFNGGAAGDLYLKIEVTPDPVFERQDDDLRVTVPLDLHTALLGGQVEVSSLDRTVNLTIPPGTAHDTVFRLRGLGMPSLRHPDRRGDLYATVELQLPQELSPEERDLIKKWGELRKKGDHSDNDQEDNQTATHRSSSAVPNNINDNGSLS